MQEPVDTHPVIKAGGPWTKDFQRVVHPTDEVNRDCHTPGRRHACKRTVKNKVDETEGARRVDP